MSTRRRYRSPAPITERDTAVGAGNDAEAAGIDRLWSIETERRAAMLESGEARTFTRDEVMQGLAEFRTTRTA